MANLDRAKDAALYWVADVPNYLRDARWERIVGED
jgi:hypothetical protein